MVFDYDPQKSRSNAKKHGITFEQAKMLWNDGGLLILPSRFPSEMRFLAIGKIENKFWTAVFTERGDNIRLISARRSRNKEIDLYEQNN